MNKSSISWLLILMVVLSYLLISLTDTQNPTNKTLNIPISKYFPEIPKKNQIQINQKEVEIGRYLFYDPILSRDSSLSCSSCHQQKFSFSDNKPFSLGIDEMQTKRNSLPLFNLIWFEQYFWDGRANSIEEQVFEPLQNHSEMDLNWTEAEKRIASSSFYQKKIKDNLKIENIDSSLISKLIAQFLRTLVSQDSKYDRVLRGEDFLTKQEKLGFELMNDQTKGKCLHCHTTDMDPLGTITGFKNNGLDTATSTTSFIDPGKGDITKKIEDYGKFKIPSVRNLGFSSPYMHDGRFKTLEEVLDFYDNPKFSITVDSKIEQHIGGASLNTIEKQAIISFLQTLNDSVFISNKNYSNPFEN